jgi:hypothetical protein
MNPVDVLRGILAAILLVAATGKLLSGRAVRANAIRAYDVVPSRLADFNATVLLIGEFIAGALLVSPLYRLGAVAALGLGFAFAAAVSTALARGRMPGCGCFGRFGGTSVGPLLLAGNLTLAGISAGIAMDVRSGVAISLWTGATVVLGLTVQAARIALGTYFRNAGQRGRNSPS